MGAESSAAILVVGVVAVAIFIGHAGLVVGGLVLTLVLVLVLVVVLLVVHFYSLRKVLRQSAFLVCPIV